MSSGIMRGQQGAEPTGEDLLVFGYACKLFRDDAKAAFIDAGGHLISWMGDQQMPIDRYDGRVHLHDLAAHEALPHGALGGQADFMSAEDARLEQMCDAERYASMGADDMDIVSREQEWDKRAAAEIPFDYSTPPPPPPPPPAQPQQGENVMDIKALASVIEKTSEFIAMQGAQMEILMRAKEAANPKFQFLNPGNPYYPIYKQVLETKRLRKQSGRGVKALSEPEPASHRATLAQLEYKLRQVVAALPSAAPTVPSIKYDKEGSDSSYLRLVARIKETQPPPAVAPTAAAMGPTPAERAAAAKRELDKVSVEVYPPPLELMQRIDKTASYVARNGGDMLSIVRKKEPEKFSFLTPKDKHFMYYQYKIALYCEMNAAERAKKAKEDGGGGGASSTAAQTPVAAATTADGDATKKFPSLKGFLR